MNFFGDPQRSVSKDLATTARVVANENWKEFIRWIDPLKDNSEVQQALSELNRRMAMFSNSPMPLEVVQGDQRVAGAYMMLLGARVAALAGVRAIDNHTLDAVAVLKQLVQDVRRDGAVQVQAILDGDDSVATEIVSLAGFVPLAELQQLVLPLKSNLYAEKTNHENGDSSNSPDDSFGLTEFPGFSWNRIAEMPRAALVQLLAHTFIETLDCPALNGLRTPEDVLEGFLEGQSLESQAGWWALIYQERAVGCVLVNKTPSGAAELVYMGLGPTTRGRGLGRILLKRGIGVARELGSDIFVAAVDCDNWPALRIYLQAGFQEHARVQAWFHQVENN